MIARLDVSTNASSSLSFRPARAFRRAAFTLTEAVIVVAMVTVVAVLLLPVISQARRASRSVACLAHLRTLGSAFRMYAHDNNDQLPYPGITQIPWEHSLLHYCSPEMFVCPGDEELGPATNSSYDWRDTGIWNTTLAGHSLTSSRRFDAILVFDSLPEWHEKSRINVGLIDGSVLSMTYDEAVVDLDKPIRN